MYVFTSFSYKHTYHPSNGSTFSSYTSFSLDIKSSKLSFNVISCIKWLSFSKRYCNVSMIRSLSYWSISTSTKLWSLLICCPVNHFQLYITSKYYKTSVGFWGHGNFFISKGIWRAFYISEFFLYLYITLSNCHLCRLGLFSFFKRQGGGTSNT